MPFYNVNGFLRVMRGYPKQRIAIAVSVVKQNETCRIRQRAALRQESWKTVSGRMSDK